VSGLLVPPGDPAALTTALAELASDAGRRRAMGERGRVRVRASYNLPESVERLRALFAGQMRA
jgi:glycosyltransferase involved in cell wall biosynthesis